MPPKRELSIRVRPEIRDALDQAVIDQGQSLTAIVETALAQFLGVDGPEQGQNLADRVRELEQRVATLEGTAMQRTAPHRDTTPPHTIPQTAPTAGAYRGEGEGMSLGDALVSAGAPIPPDVARSTNRSRAMLAATGQSAAEWLVARGWEKRGKRWYRG